MMLDQLLDELHTAARHLRSDPRDITVNVIAPFEGAFSIGCVKATLGQVAGVHGAHIQLEVR